MISIIQCEHEMRITTPLVRFSLGNWFRCPKLGKQFALYNSKRQYFLAPVALMTTYECNINTKIREIRTQIVSPLVNFKQL